MQNSEIYAADRSPSCSSPAPGRPLDASCALLPRSAYEILAPVGSDASLSAAIAAGADAVYFGVGELNMRAHAAGDFERSDLPRLAARCRDAGIKSYLTVNTVLYDDDLPAMRALLDEARDAGVSAVILSDAAALLYARAIGLNVHLSTQLSISNLESLRFYAQFANAVVLARELTLERIAHIAAEAAREKICGPSGEPVRIECFAHGALCMAVSGRCYLSLHTRGKSANRGECLQTCRRRYRLVDPEHGTEIDVEGKRFLSPKDLSTISIMDRMVAAGIRIFKIEGRARGPEYVRTTVECYRAALEAVLAGEFTAERAAAWTEQLARVFNRGFWTGWYLGSETLERTSDYGSSAAVRKAHAGKCLNCFTKAGIGHFLVEAGELREGDDVLVIGPTTGAVTAKVSGLRVNDAVCGEACKGDEVTFAIPERVRPGDRLYRLLPR